MSISQSEKIMKYMVIIVNVILVALTLLGVVKTCFVGFDIDEAYAVAQSYRMVMGDNMFSQMWESHQMSAFGLAIFILPYLIFTGGQTTGIILYLRIVGTIIHLILGWWFYKTAKEKFGTSTGLFIMFAHVNFLPKWLVLAEFEIMQYWAVCIIFLALLTWHEKTASAEVVPAPDTENNRKKSKIWKWHKEDGWLILSGAALFMAMMTYPTMVLLYPVYVAALLVLKGRRAKEKWRSVLLFTGTTFIIGVAFLLYLRTYMTVEEFIKYVSYIFMDESHGEPLAVRFKYYGREWEKLLEEMPRYMMWAAINSGIIGIAEVVIRKIRDRRSKKAGDNGVTSEAGRHTPIGKIVLKYVLIFMILWFGVFVGEHIRGSLLEDKNQFYLYFRFLFASIVGVICFATCLRQNAEYFWLGILPGLAGMMASVLVTNMSFEISVARAYIGVMATFFMVGNLIKEKYNQDMALKAVSYIVACVFIGGLILSKLILVRVTGCLPVTLKMDMAWVKEGPAAGLLAQESIAVQYNENIPLIEAYVDENDCLLYFGCENIYYMVSGADIGTPSVQGTTVFNEMFFKYYEEHPEREPDIVIIDKTFETNPVYNYSEQNDIMKDWIEEEFKNAKVTETTYFTILER